MTNFIQLHKQPNHVAILTFNRPDVLNALNLAAMQAFANAVHTLQADPDVRAVILTGAGEKAFCSGGDLVELSGRTTEADALHFITIMGDALLALEQLPVPVIAAINGYALGGGSEIAMACDLRIVDTQVKMGFVQIHMKVTAGWGAGQRLLRAVGYARAFELFLKGQVLRADDLATLGLVNQIAPQGAALAHALAFADQIAQQPPALVASIKQLLQAGLQQSYTDALQTERALFPPLWVSDAHLQAVDTFLNRRENEN